MSTNKRGNQRNWKKTLTVTGLVTGSLILGTLGNLQASADVNGTSAANGTTTKTAENEETTSDQPTATLAPKATVIDRSATETGNATPQHQAGETPGKRTGTVAATPQQTVKTDQTSTATAPNIQTPVAKTQALTPTNGAKPVNPVNQGTNPQGQKWAASSTPTITGADATALDGWMPDRNFQQVVLAAFQAQQRDRKANLLNKYESIRWSPKSTDAQKADAQAKINEANGIQLFTDVSQITQKNMATLINFDPAYRRSENGDPAAIERGAGYQGTLHFTSLQGLQYADKLQTLSLTTSDPNPDTWQRGAFSDLKQLANLNLENLTSLDVSETSVSDLTPVMKLPNLKSISANNDLITSLTPKGQVLAGGSNEKLMPFSQLTHLEVDDNHLTSLAGLEGATHLTELLAQDNVISNVKALANVTDPMTMLYLGGNAIHDLSPLAKVQFAAPLFANDQSVVLADDEAIKVDTTKDSVVMDSPILAQNGQQIPMTAYLGQSIAQTSLRANPTGQAATKITWRGVTKYGKRYLIVQWNDGNSNYNGNLYMPYELVTPAPTTDPTTKPTKPTTDPTTKPTKPTTGPTTKPTKPTTDPTTKPAKPTTNPTPTPSTTAVVTPDTDTNQVDQVVTKPVAPSTPVQKPAKPVFKPFMIYTKQALYRYTQPTFKIKRRAKYYRRYPRQTAPTFKVIGIKRSANGRLRYKLANGSYVTARKTFVYNLYWQGKHYTKIKLDRTIYQYKHAKFAKVNRQKRLKKGTIVTVMRVVHRGYMTRYQLSNGSYITGNKQFITPRQVK
ncbi:DUF5776 domain-containing protein [Levilactobacillus acidifarinae]|uniref:DUF5776 domain-containing protein n=1 Tax=Levilactobacillus acidifarinae DSM 19394 = JCM 15949 TaxID=1423715 RepID=A0A0R1LGU3_9LACO|nr:DUF5776 domain-containing protein [Levilactobacillus acidifarinae]KRK94885.1 hypothetical protein FD25_GL000863 [Levilactobacillus acidifarinae DSM 19394]GEO70285.1 hypothetical protein LAC03_21950 [Levilactobacillus acidifarinae]